MGTVLNEASQVVITSQADRDGKIPGNSDGCSDDDDGNYSNGVVAE